MIDDRIEELMWLEIDDSISETDRRRLWAHLGEHPEDREHFDQLRELAALFGGASELDPPPELRNRIRQAIDTMSPQWMRSPRRTTFWRRLCGFLAPRPAWRLAAAAALGAFVGIMGYYVITYDSGGSRVLDTNQMSGTIGLPATEDGALMSIDLPAATGSFAVLREGAHVRSSLTVASETTVDILIGYKGRTLRYGGADPADRSWNQVTVEDHGIRVQNRGEGSYFFLFELPQDPTSPFVVKILSENAVLLEDEIVPEPEKE